MALRQVRIGGNDNILQYDDGVHSTAIHTDNQPIDIGASTQPTEAVRQDQLPTLGNVISSDAVIGDNQVVRGDGGARKIQGSQATLDDAGSVSIPAGQAFNVGGVARGDASGPAASTDNAIARFNGAGGKTLQNSGLILDDSDNLSKTGDLEIDCGANKTTVWIQPIWEDLNFDPDRSGGPAVSLPDYVTINNVIHREFTNANNQLCGSSQEIPHKAKLSETLYPHIHIFLKSGEGAGTTGVTFTFYWELRQSSGTTSGSVTLTATSAQLTANGNKVDIYDAVGFTGPTELDSQLAVTIARTAGDAEDVVVSTYGVHYKIDTGGSRQITTK